ncbi:YdaU family protein [Acinetobacter sp. ME22]|nr:YdaU family protein [Acinetobacter sp. ME22]MCG2572361.1 YdaU family protein [Acinetobacter sp. ME22]
MHYYKRNIGDYHKKAGRLSMLEHGAYTLLLDSCYDRERFPTLDEALEWAWARTEEEEAAVKFVLRRFFTEIDGLYVQSHIQEELEAYKAKAETNARIAKEREEKRKVKKQSVHDEAPSVNETCNSGDEVPPQQHESPPNHKPLTNNHKPITINHSVKAHTQGEGEQAQAEEQTWTPDQNMLLNVIRESVGVQAQSVLDMPDYKFHLGNFNAHWENKSMLTENQRTRKFAGWLISEFKKPQHVKQNKNSQIQADRNVNEKWKHEPQATGDLQLVELPEGFV